MRLIKKYFPQILLIIYLVELYYLAFNPFDRAVWWAENLPIMIAVAILVITYKKFRYSNFSYFLMAFFLMFHTIGGHYSFARVPFDFFNNILDSLNLDFFFPEDRNNFDRLGHFLVGVFAYPIAELAYLKKWVTNKWTAIFLGIFALGFWGAFYEVIETIYAITEGGDAGASFLGSQGDIWDAQKDMALDILGATLVSIVFLFRFKKGK